MENTFFLANYLTHAQMWHLVDSGEFRDEPQNAGYVVKDREGRTIYVWYSIFPTYSSMERSFLRSVRLADDLGDTTETVVLGNESQMGHYV